jgi:hypothetical protein
MRERRERGGYESGFSEPAAGDQICSTLVLEVVLHHFVCRTMAHNPTSSSVRLPRLAHDSEECLEAFKIKACKAGAYCVLCSQPAELAAVDANAPY